MTDDRFPPVPGGYPFPALEQEVLERWHRERIFEKSLERPGGRDEPEGEFVFYDGPPTANNAPHVGHVVTRVVKDLFPRFRTMQGWRVARKAGWDTHGLPVEIEVEKRLGFTGKRQIEEYGIEAFNRECLESVHAYERQWRAMSERVGYWMDFDGAYWTYKNEYIESVWWALARLHEKDLLYEGFKVQWYCARCGTGLSSHEVAQNYQETDDPSIWTLFVARPGQTVKTLDGGELSTDDRRLELVAWTTTPWTTLANVALAVHPELTYKAVEHPGRPDALLLFGEELGTAVPLAIERRIDEHDVKREQIDLRELPAVERFSGRDLEGLLYERLYTFAEPDLPGRVVLGDYVTASEGTGLVHTAPPFGEDDYATSRRYDLALIFSVDDEGRIKPGFGHWEGRWFKDADAEIVKDLRARGLLLHADRYRHNYPFCWRCDRPLLSFARTSWFVRTTAKKERLIELNKEEIAWHPRHIGEGRFGNWLENVVDWALSRRRYWGTPLPVWRCDGCERVEVVGSYERLFELNGRARPADFYNHDQFDPHRPFIDEFTWPCAECAEPGRTGTFRRVEDVIDAWFDSGAMPFAQHHYMGQPLPKFDPYAMAEIGFDQVATSPRGFPAHFIAEAIDQTRGWFYTLHVLGVLLFDSVAYQNCLVLGHVNDEQGRKMSKRLGNVVEPLGVIEETGADALRWYFCVNDPEQNSRFSARLVREAAQGLLIPLWNALSFFTIYANLDGWHPGRAAAPAIADRAWLDQWILLRLEELLGNDSPDPVGVTACLDGYAVAEAARLIEKFVDDMTNWYIRRSRDRFWAENPESVDKEAAYHTLYEVLTTLTRVIAPFTPFVSELLHGHLLRSQRGDALASVHLEAWPDQVAILSGAAEYPFASKMGLLQGMGLAQRIVTLGRAARNTHNLKVRQPLPGVWLVANSKAQRLYRRQLEGFEDLILDELNVKEIRWVDENARTDFVRHEVRPNFRALGKRLGKLMPKVKAALESADGDLLAAKLEQHGSIELEIDGEILQLQRKELEIPLIEKEGLATAGDRELLVALDTAITLELRAEGWAREVVNRIQTARKNADLDYAERIRVRYRAADELEAAIDAHRGWIAGETLAVELAQADGTATGAGGALTLAAIDDHDFALAIERVTGS
jgi:isoleucyl-tRNA synthetase